MTEQEPPILGDDWDRFEKIGERTGRRWIKFTGESEFRHNIWVTSDTLCDPMKWR